MSLLDTPVREAAWAALDFESAGATPGRSDEPVQVGIAVWRGGEMTEFFRSYVHSPARITRSARAVHGIGEDDVRNAPAMAALWPLDDAIPTRNSFPNGMFLFGEAHRATSVATASSSRSGGC